jgi:hypothetical protein
VCSKSQTDYFLVLTKYRSGAPSRSALSQANYDVGQLVAGSGLSLFQTFVQLQISLSARPWACTLARPAAHVARQLRHTRRVSCPVQYRAAKQPESRGRPRRHR